MKIRQSIRQDEAGVALLELGIVLPLFLLFLIIGVIEVGSMIINYQEVTSIVREGVRLGGKLEGLEPGFSDFEGATASAVASSEFTEPDGTTSGSIPPNHDAVRSRIVQLLYLADFPSSESEIEVNTSFYDDCTNFGAGAGCDAETEGTLGVSVSVSYNGIIFPLMDWVKIRVSRRGPYLYSS